MDSEKNKLKLRSELKNWAVFISGNGSNLQILLNQNYTKLNIELVVSSRKDAYGLERAQKHNVESYLLPSKLNQQDWSQLSLMLKNKKIDFIFLLGFFKIVPSYFVKEWDRRILNLHPSLLPAFKGLKAIENAYAANAPIGVTIHWVTEGLDEGPILLQEKLVPESPSEYVSLEDLTDKVHQLEHKLVLKAVEICQSHLQEY